MTLHVVSSRENFPESIKFRDPPSLAVVGCGYWGSKHVRVGRETPGLKVTMAVDSRQERLDHIRSEYPGVSVARSFDAVLQSDIDAVILATPVSTHFKMAAAALQAGKHVLVEKPMATTGSECLELIAMAEARNLVLMVGHTFEYHPAIAAIQSIIARGDLGTPYYVSSRRLNLGLYQSDVNVLWDLAPHDFSIVFSILGSEIDKIAAWGSSYILSGVEDVVYAKLGFRNGLTAHIHVSWLDPVKVRNVTVVGSEGMLVFDDVLPSEKVRVYDKRFKPLTIGDSYADFQSAYHHGDVHIPSISNAEPLKLELLDFVNAIVSGKQPRADGQSGLRVVRALEAATTCLRSTRAGTEVEVEYGRPTIVRRPDIPAAF